MIHNRGSLFYGGTKITANANDRTTKLTVTTSACAFDGQPARAGQRIKWCVMRLIPGHLSTSELLFVFIPFIDHSINGVIVSAQVDRWGEKKTVVKALLERHQRLVWPGTSSNWPECAEELLVVELNGPPPKWMIIFRFMMFGVIYLIN